MRRSPSKPPSDKPIDESADESIETVKELPDLVLEGASELGLSRAQLDEVIKAMSVAALCVGLPEHIHRLEVVSAGFIMAITKPISERPSIEEWNRYVAWMCAITQYAAMTIRKSKHQRLLGQGHSDDEMGALVPVSGDEDTMVARELVDKALSLLKPDDREILKAYFFDDTNTEEMAREQGLPPSTVSWRFRRATRNMRRAVKSLLVLILVFVTKNARAQGARLAQHVPLIFPQVMQAACVMTVTVACGIIVPSASAATVVSQESTATVRAAPPSITAASATMLDAPSLVTEVEPVKPIAIDELEKQCSACDMNSFKIASYLRATILPTALLVAPAATQVACAGAEQRQTPPPQEPDELDDSLDPYIMMCENERRRGDDCVSRADWCAKLGMRPAPNGCQ